MLVLAQRIRNPDVQHTVFNSCEQQAVYLNPGNTGIIITGLDMQVFTLDLRLQRGFCTVKHSNLGAFLKCVSARIRGTDNQCAVLRHIDVDFSVVGHEVVRGDISPAAAETVLNLLCSDILIVRDLNRNSALCNIRPSIGQHKGDLIRRPSHLRFFRRNWHRCLNGGRLF